MYFDSRVPQGLGQNEQDLFFISTDFTGGNSLGIKGGGADVKNLVVTIDQDAHVLLVGGARVITDQATAQTSQAFAPILVTLTMSSSGRQLMNQAQHIENVLGTAQLPAAWPRPKFLVAASSMRVTLQNLHAANPFNVRITFYAFKIFVGSTAGGAA